MQKRGYINREISYRFPDNSGGEGEEENSMKDKTGKRCDDPLLF